MSQPNKTARRETADPVMRKLEELYDGLIQHDGFGEIRVEVRLLKRRQKEVILHCGKQYRFVVGFEPAGLDGAHAADARKR